MRVQFLVDMLIGWVVYTPEGRKAANKVINDTTKLINDTIKNSGLLPRFATDKQHNDKEKNGQLTVMNNN